MSDTLLRFIGTAAFFVSGWFGAKAYYLRPLREDSAILDYLYRRAHTLTSDTDTTLPLMLPTREAIARKLKEESCPKK